MTKKSLSFAALKRILERMGFDARATTEGPVVFRHAKTDTVLVFPKRTTTVRPHRIESIRRILTGRGVVTEEAFDERISSGRAKASVACATHHSRASPGQPQNIFN